MMEVETAAQPAWDQFKEEVEIMEEEGSDAGAEELLTREIKKRLLDHGHENGNGDANGGGGEEEVPEAEEQHTSISFDPAQVPDIITEVSARYLVKEAAQSGSEEEEDTNETPSPKGKEIEAHENGSAQETNGSHSNGSHHVSNGAESEIPFMFRMDKTEIFPAEVDKDEHVIEAQPEESGSHSNGSQQVSNGAEPEMAFTYRIDKTEIFPTEVSKVEHATEAQPEIEEYDLEKILDQQETHDLYCPNCKSCITRRVILRKRKRTARPATPDEPPKRPHTEEAPSPPVPERDEQESPEVFRCLSCFSFFIPTGSTDFLSPGCSFNIFRIFGRRDQHVDVLPPHASEDMPRSENCTSWLLSCFQPGDGPNQAAADSLQTPLLLDTATSGDTTTTTTATNTSYVHSHDTVVKPEQSSESSSQHQTTTTTTTTTTTSATATTSSTTTSAAASTSSHTSSAIGIFHTDVMEVITGEMPPPKPVGGAILGASQLLDQEDIQGPATPTVENGSFSSHATHTSGFKVDTSNVTNTVPGFIPRDNIPTSPGPQAADPPHLVVSVSEDVNPATPRPQQRDDWDILKAIVYGGLVESITSLSVVSAAASSGAKTLDIFILGIANLIGGLPLIFHNIADLRDIQDVDGNDEQVGHYWLQLGRRSKSQLHMVLALLSYIIFGLLPPVLYGFSFGESNDRENKMMTVAAASLACILLLALGKAHVQNIHRTYFKTLMYYLAITVSCSGLSYVAGVLITRLLVQFSVIDQGGASAAPAPPGLSSFPHAVGSQTSAWASF